MSKKEKKHSLHDFSKQVKQEVQRIQNRVRKGIYPLANKIVACRTVDGVLREISS